MMKKCPRELIAHYLSDKLELDDKLVFFAHLDHCPECWDEVYNAVKAQHPHYYKTKSRPKLQGNQAVRTRTTGNRGRLNPKN
jgi:hypothetical protein